MASFQTPHLKTRSLTRSGNTASEKTPGALCRRKGIRLCALQKVQMHLFQRLVIREQLSISADTKMSILWPSESAKWASFAIHSLSSPCSISWAGRRVYLSSMTSYDFATSTWSNMSTYAAGGNSGSSNSTASNIPPILRADSTTTYVPNLGTDNKGVLVMIGGGNDEQMIENSVLDVYDIGAGAFVKQSTQGQIMTPRVNHCAVRGSAIVNDEEQHMIYVYGGQPSNRSTQLTEGQSTDLYILTLPSYTWTYVGSNLTSQPVARAGHTCELLGDQMISIGGYIAEDIICEQPAIWVLNTTSLEWITEFSPGRNFTTPELLRSITGGTGTSNSTGGNGWAGPNNNYNPATATRSGPTTTVTSDPSKMQDSDSKSKLGPM